MRSISMIAYVSDSTIFRKMALWSRVVVVHSIDYCTKKETALTVGHFTTISGLFSANYINIFHKNGVQTNILRCLTYLNLNWIKSYNIKHIFIHFRGFSILEEKKFIPHKRPFYDHFWPFCRSTTTLTALLEINSTTSIAPILTLLPLHTISFDWFLSSLEWILDLEFC